MDGPCCRFLAYAPGWIEGPSPLLTFPTGAASCRLSFPESLGRGNPDLGGGPDTVEVNGPQGDDLDWDAIYWRR